MAKRGDPEVLRLLVIFLRSHARMTQAQFGREARVDQAQLSRYELGNVAPSEEVLRRMAKVARIDESQVMHLRQVYSVLLGPAARQALVPASQAFDFKLLEPVLLAVTPYLIELQTAEPVPPSAEEERRLADQIWTALEKYPVRFRRRLIELSPHSGSRALAERVVEASVKAADGNPGRALELAELALSIVRKVPGKEEWCSRLNDDCRAHRARLREDLVHTGNS